MQLMLAESSMNVTQTSPEWEMVEKPAPVPLEPQDRWGHALGTYGPFALTSPRYSGAGEEEFEEREKEAKKNREYAGMSWTACYDDGCFVHLSEKQGQWFPQELKKHTINRNLPYATQTSPAPAPPQPPKPKHGNTREMHAERGFWDKCNRKGCKTHKEEKSRNTTKGTVRTRLEEEGGKKLQEGGSGEEAEVDNDEDLEWADILQLQHIMRETIPLQDETIGSYKKRSNNSGLLLKSAQPLSQC